MAENEQHENPPEHLEDGERKEGITIYIHEKQEELKLDEKELSNLSNISKCHIITGSITILLQAITLVLNNPRMVECYEGIVLGILIITTGSLGLYYLRDKSRTILIFFLVLSIISALACIVLLAFASVRISLSFFIRPRGGEDLHRTLASLEIIISILQGVTLITGSTLCCKLFCCTNNAPRRAHYKDRTIQVLSWCQIAIGLIFVIMWFPNFYVFKTRIVLFDEIWCGLFFLITGIIGLFSVSRFYKLITPFLILNIVGCLFFITLCTITSFRMSESVDRKYHQNREYRRDLDFYKSEYYNCTEQVIDFKRNPVSDEDFAPLDVEIEKCEKDRRKRIKDLEETIKEVAQKGTIFDIFYNVLVVQLLLCIFEFIVLVTSAGFICHVCCCCCAASQQLDTTAVYVSPKQLETGENVVHVARERRLQNQALEDGEDGRYARMN